MELTLNLKQQLNQQQLQSIEILQLSSLELEQYIQKIAEENPVIDPEPVVSEDPSTQKDDALRRQEWFEENDHQNRYYQRVDRDDYDPFYQAGNAGGLEETLSSFLFRQLHKLRLSRFDEHLIRYLILCLDKDGYFRFSLPELSAELSLPLSELEKSLVLLRTLEPAGVGAGSLSQCLELQLERIHYTGPALDIVRHHLEELGRHHYREIASSLSISLDAVLEAMQVIRELEPRPGSIFSAEETTHYIQPDVYVIEQNGQFLAHVRGDRSVPFRINPYYQQLYAESTDAETKEYLAGKLRQAENILDAMQRRESTITRCTQAILEHQQAFFQNGPSALVSLRMSDVAQELDLHDSTISRAIREKYLQCSHGVFPLRYFFANSASSKGEPDASASPAAAKTLIQKIISEEDSTRPLSDQKIADRMADLGCPISRRTVAKYRDELHIPGTFGRKKH